MIRADDESHGLSLGKRIIIVRRIAIDTYEVSLPDRVLMPVQNIDLIPFEHVMKFYVFMDGKGMPLRLMGGKTDGKGRDRPKEIQRFKRELLITKKQYITPRKAKSFLQARLQ